MSEDLSMNKWKDQEKICVLLGSNMHNPQEVSQAQRMTKDGKMESRAYSQAIYDYNLNMNGVD